MAKPTTDRRSSRPSAARVKVERMPRDRQAPRFKPSMPTIVDSDDHEPNQSDTYGIGFGEYIGDDDDDTSLYELVALRSVAACVQSGPDRGSVHTVNLCGAVQSSRSSINLVRHDSPNDAQPSEADATCASSEKLLEAHVYDDDDEDLSVRGTYPSDSPAVELSLKLRAKLHKRQTRTIEPGERDGAAGKAELQYQRTIRVYEWRRAVGSPLAPTSTRTAGQANGAPRVLTRCSERVSDLLCLPTLNECVPSFGLPRMKRRECHWQRICSGMALRTRYARSKAAVAKACRKMSRRVLTMVGKRGQCSEYVHSKSSR